MKHANEYLKWVKKHTHKNRQKNDMKLMKILYQIIAI